MGDVIFARNILVLDIASNIGILFIFKYLDFSISTVNSFFHTDIPLKNIALPIGLFFFTFLLSPM